MAAGSGTRAVEESGVAKQYVEIAGMTVLAHAIGAFITHPRVDAVAVVISQADRQAYRDAIANRSPAAKANSLSP